MQIINLFKKIISTFKTELLMFVIFFFSFQVYLEDIREFKLK